MAQYLHPLPGPNQAGSSLFNLSTLAECCHYSATLVQNGAESEFDLVAPELAGRDIINQCFHIPRGSDDSFDLLKDAHCTVYQPYEIWFKLGQFFRFRLGLGQVNSQIKGQDPDFLAEPVNLVNQAEVSVLFGISVQLDQSTL